MQTIKIYKSGRLHAVWCIAGLSIAQITPVLRCLHTNGFTFKLSREVTK